MFDPPTSYDVIPSSTKLEDFYKYPEDYVVRPPYQRKSVWSYNKKQALLDSLFRRYYVPKIVLREIKLTENEKKLEVIDGQQRISVAREFYQEELTLPQSLKDLNSQLPGKKYTDLSVEIRQFVDKTLQYAVDTVKGIDDPHDPEHQQTAAEIFWRLQQGESLNYMEVAHARLSSLPRNFVVKYADEISFDYEKYEPIEDNHHRHDFFKVISRPNDRMQHLALLTRLLILEEQEGPADIGNANVSQFIDKGHDQDGIGNYSYEGKRCAKAVLSNMSAFSSVFRDDVTDGRGIPELREEYVIVSIFLLLRHLRRFYVFGDDEKQIFRDFTFWFDERRRGGREDDSDIQVFTSSRRQGRNEIMVRDRVIRQLFFSYIQERGVSFLSKDPKRSFNEAERIAIYRKADGVCQECRRQGLTDEEAKVSWSEYEVDHVLPHSKGGATDVENAQVLCRTHNRSKGATVATMDS